MNSIMEIQPEDFSALCAMTQELLNIGINPLTTWQAFKEYLESFRRIQNVIPKPTESYFNQVFNFPLESLDHGGIFLTMHFSAHFRAIPFEITRLLRKMGNQKKMWILFSQDSYKNENEDWVRHGRELNFEALVAQDAMIARHLMSILKKGEFVVVFMDATEGYGADSDPIILPWLHYPVRVRSGLFRIADKMKSTIFPVLASASLEEPNLFFGEPQLFQHVMSGSRNDAFKAAEACLTFFSKFILASPYAWLHWGNHLQKIVQEQYSHVEGAATHEERFVTCKTEDETIYLDISTGEVYVEEQSG